MGVRTLRRLEAGQGSLATLQRVMRALDLEPQAALPGELEAVAQHQWISRS